VKRTACEGAGANDGAPPACGVGGAVGIAEHAVAQVVDAPLVLAHQRVEALDLAAPRRFDQALLLVGHRYRSASWLQTGLL
jgi:hypothetical protein